MGLTFIDITIRPSPKSRQSRTLPVLVDTGASRTVVPGKLLRELGIEPHERLFVDPLHRELHPLKQRL